MQDYLAAILAILDLFLPGMSYQETAGVLIDRLSMDGLEIVEKGES